MNKVTHYHCWIPDEEDRDDGKTYDRTSYYGASDVAEAYALRCYESGDPFNSTDVTVESLDAAGNVLATESFTAEADYDVSFYAYKNEAP